jgi:hypothetical protein
MYQRTKKQGVWMKSIQNKNRISQKFSYTYPFYLIKMEVFCMPQLTRMCQLVTFGELINGVDTTGTGSMCVVASRVPIFYGCTASF